MAASLSSYQQEQQARMLEEYEVLQQAERTRARRASGETKVEAKRQTTASRYSTHSHEYQ